MLTQRYRHADRPVLGNLLNCAKGAFSHWRTLDRIDRPEMEAVARDRNTSTTELTTLMVTSLDSLELLRKRFAYAELSEKALASCHPAELRDLQRVCSLCTSKAQRAKDLRHQCEAAPLNYCPDEPLLRLLALKARRDRHGASIRFVHKVFLISIKPCGPRTWLSDRILMSKELAP